MWKRIEDDGQYEKILELIPEGSFYMRKGFWYTPRQNVIYVKYYGVTPP